MKGKAMTRILVVDDEESIRVTLSTILRKEGYEVSTAGSFNEVAQILPQFPPDTIILDVLLPRVSGLDILKYLKEQGVETPVIVITGAPDIQSARESLRHGAYDYIAKPFSLDVLRQSVRRAVNQKELMDARHELEERKRRYQEELESQVRERTAELQRRNIELATLNRVGAILAGSLTLEDTLQAALAETLEAAESPAGAVYLLHSEQLTRAASVSVGRRPPFPKTLDAALLANARRGAATVAATEAPDAMRGALAANGVPAVALVPLVAKAEAEGLLAVACGSPQGPDQANCALLVAIAQQMAVAVQNAHLFEEAVTQRQHTEAIIQNMADGVLVLDKQGRIAASNPALRNILGIAAEQVMGRPIHDFADSTVSGLSGLWEIAVSSGASAERESSEGESESELPVVTTCEIALPEPLNRTLMIYTSPLRDAAKNPLGQVKVVRDITRERELERMKSDFISIVSHELRTPVFYIKGFIEILLQGKAENPKVRGEFLNIIRDQTEHLGKLVEDLLDTSKLERGALVLKKERVPVADLIHQAVADAEGLATQDGVALEVEIKEPLPEVAGDFMRLKQVMTNLLGNAIKFSKPGGKVYIRGLLTIEEVWVQVEDRGPGISPKSISHVFDKFFQADSSATRSAGGVGLGLYIVRQIIEGLGGRIWVESELGKGTMFTFALPLREQNAGS